MATGLVEPPAALFGYGVAETSGALLPLGLAFAGGAMVYVVVDELVPECHARGFERYATFGVVAGFALMMALDNAFGSSADVAIDGPIGSRARRRGYCVSSPLTPHVSERRYPSGNGSSGST